MSSFGACLIPLLITWGLRFLPSDLYMVRLLLFDEYIFSVSLFMAAVSFVVSIFVTGPLNAGLAGYFIKSLSDAENPPSALSVCDCFGPGYFRLSMGMLAYRAVGFLVVALPLSLLLLPGMLTVEVFEGISVYRAAMVAWPIVLFALLLYLFVDTSLSLVPYLLVSHPALNVFDTLAESFRLTRGHVIELLIMQLSFLFWLWVVALTLFVGMFYVYPYIEATHAAYYLELSRMRKRTGLEVAPRED